VGKRHRRIRARTDVVGIFRNDRSLIRVAGMLCIEQNDAWLVGWRLRTAVNSSGAVKATA
jgi:transposase-like protein